MSISFPVKRRQFCFRDPLDYAVTGDRKTESIIFDGPQNPFESLTADLFLPIIEERMNIIGAREKFRNFNASMLKEKFPNWTMEQILDLKSQFQTFDLNQDGLIDFQELSNVLDELGDESDEETRRRYFRELDEDNSGAVDFEEYLTLVNAMSSKQGKITSTKLGFICSKGSENANRLRKMSVVQQIDNGLF